MSKKKMADQGFGFRVSTTLLLGLVNVLDAKFSNRSISSQLRHLYRPFLAVPNVLSTLFSPLWLRREIWAGRGLLIPSQRKFPHLHELRQVYSQIRAETEAALQHAKPLSRELPFKGISDEKWKAIHLKWFGKVSPGASELFPSTLRALETMPEVQVAMISIMEPGAKTTLHFGASRLCLRYHLGLTTPNDPACNIEVDGQPYHWRDGEDVMFDDTFLHQVHNNTGKTRVILFLDVERPHHFLFRAPARLFLTFLGRLIRRLDGAEEKRREA